jgi:hypothetical protein
MPALTGAQPLGELASSMLAQVLQDHGRRRDCAGGSISLGLAQHEPPIDSE